MTLQIDDSQAFIPDVWRVYARHFPNKEAAICGTERITWRQFDEGLNRVANGLRSMNIGRGDKVAIVMSNSIDMLLVMFGIIKAGACVVPLSALLSADQLRGLIKDSDATVLFASDSTKDLVLPIADQLAKIPADNRFAFNFSAPGWVDLADWLSVQPITDPGVAYQMTDPVNIIYSSGTTGLPKGIVQTHRARQHFAWSNVIEMGFTRHSRALVTTALYSNGTWLMALPVLFGGGTLHIMESFDAEGFLSHVEREKITHTFMVPTQYIITLECENFEKYDLSSLLVMLSAGSPLRVETKKDVMARMCSGMFELYGFSEGSATMIKPEDAEDKWGSVGTPVIGFDIRIIDDSDNELPFGETGEIVAYGGGIMKEYHNRPAASVEIIWQDAAGRTFLRSGDIGKFDEDGFLYILDRKKDMIISGGFNVFPADIESIVGEHEDVSDVTVIGIPHDKWGETPLAFIIPKQDKTVDLMAIKAWANERLAKPQRISAIELRDDFPRNALGKVIKRELREPYWSN
ncbi:MAG: AMP-dependent synthetase [Alphaproteobacteria bacterium]|nr:MAG: AMP-dependent synthetase [Alphaproteobacteria bacterium]